MILCGTDLSAYSDPAVQVAATWAKRSQQHLLLLHAAPVDEEQTRMSAAAKLDQAAGELRQRYGVPVETRVVVGDPVSELLEAARATKAELVVVGAVGANGKRRRLGSVPERLCQAAGVPVLVARDATGFQAWSSGGRPLKVLLGCGLGGASRAALLFIANWPELALTVAHVAWPYGEHVRLGIAPPIPLDELRPEIQRQLLDDLGRWASASSIQTAMELQVSPGWGRIDSHLAQLAHEKQADLLVVGNHRRNLVERVWHGSVSRNAIHEASGNVLCVPHTSVATTVPQRPRVVVVATDFSELADRAIPIAYSLADEGATVHLVHVMGEGSAHEREVLLAKLGERVPQASTRGIRSEVVLLEASAAWRAIWQHAGRASADLICLSTHSRDALKSLVLGSQAQALLQHSRIPVVLVPPDRES